MHSFFDKLWALWNVLLSLFAKLFCSWLHRGDPTYPRPLVLLLFLYSHFCYPSAYVSFILFVSKLAIIVINFVCGRSTKWFLFSLFASYNNPVGLLDYYYRNVFRWQPERWTNLAQLATLEKVILSESRAAWFKALESDCLVNSKLTWSQANHLPKHALPT